MPWSFNATGTKEQCVEQLEASNPPDDPANAQHFEFVRSVLRHELARYGEGSKEMSIAASGHVPGEGFSDRSLSIWISGKAIAPAAEPEPAKTAPSTKKR